MLIWAVWRHCMWDDVYNNIIIWPGALDACMLTCHLFYLYRSLYVDFSSCQSIKPHPSNPPQKMKVRKHVVFYILSLVNILIWENKLRKWSWNFKKFYCKTVCQKFGCQTGHSALCSKSCMYWYVSFHFILKGSSVFMIVFNSWEILCKYYKFYHNQTLNS